MKRQDNSYRKDINTWLICVITHARVIAVLFTKQEPKWSCCDATTLKWIELNGDVWLQKLGVSTTHIINLIQNNVGIYKIIGKTINKHNYEISWPTNILVKAQRC